MKQIFAEDFIRHWHSFSAFVTSEDEWVEQWQKDASWSKCILGTKSSSEKLSPVGEYFKKKYPGLRYRTEDGLFDLTMTLHANYQDIPTLDNNFNRDKFNLESNYYPTIYDILLEHENKIYCSWQEIAKLTYVRGLLKVLITYNSDEITPDQLKKENAMMIEMASTIIAQSAVGFPDNSETEYLLLVGRKEDYKLLWTSLIFSFNGTLIKQVG